jgi:predicted translin family RNA/ssDNA-binding protein
MASAGFGEKRELLLGGLADDVGEMGRIITREAMIGELRTVGIAASVTC